MTTSDHWPVITEYRDDAGDVEMVVALESFGCSKMTELEVTLHLIRRSGTDYCIRM